MFDIGFSEMMVIAVVALVVIGPERLPKVARTVGTLLGRMQRYVNDVKAEVEREMRVEELKKLQTSVEDQARSIERTVQTELNETERSLRDLAEGQSSPAPDTATQQPVTESELPGERASDGQLELNLGNAAVSRKQA